MATIARVYLGSPEQPWNGVNFDANGAELYGLRIEVTPEGEIKMTNKPLMPCIDSKVSIAPYSNRGPKPPQAEFELAPGTCKAQMIRGDVVVTLQRTNTQPGGKTDEHSFIMTVC